MNNKQIIIQKRTEDKSPTLSQLLNLSHNGLQLYMILNHSERESVNSTMFRLARINKQIFFNGSKNLIENCLLTKPNERNEMFFYQD